MGEIKYAVYPGMIRSRNDGDWHYVGAAQLIRLYGVRPSECLIVVDDRDRMGGRGEGLIPLHPQHDYKEVI